MHGWTPLTVVHGADVDKVILADTTQHLNTISVNTSGSPKTVTAGAGATLDSILQALQNAGLGLGVGARAGCADHRRRAGGERPRRRAPPHGRDQPRHDLRVAQQPGRVAHRRRVEHRAQRLRAQDLQPVGPRDQAPAHPPGPGVHHLGDPAGRANYRLRCQSWYDIPTSTLFGPPGTAAAPSPATSAPPDGSRRSGSRSPRSPWVKVWTPTPNKPFFSRKVNVPYNYPFSDNLPPRRTSSRVRSLGQPAGTPLRRAAAPSWPTGIIATGTWDIWGWSKDTLLYIRPTTLRLSEGGGAVITSRANVQRVINEFTTWYANRIAHYRVAGPVPDQRPGRDPLLRASINPPTSGPPAGPPTISSMRPRPDHPEWDTAIWLNVLGIPNTPGMYEFYRGMEQWMIAISGSYAAFRPEWSKGWAFTAASAYNTGPQ